MALKSVRVTTRVRDDLAREVRSLARDEGQSVSKMVGQSIQFLDIVPREFRDIIVELNTDENDEALAKIGELFSLMAGRYQAELSA